MVYFLKWAGSIWFWLFFGLLHGILNLMLDFGWVEFGLLAQREPCSAGKNGAFPF